MSNNVDNVTPKGVLLVVSGPSGAGKGTICQMLRDQLPDLGYSISVTTRAPRTGEVDGESYFFKTIPEVKQMIEKGELLEYAEVYGNYWKSSWNPAVTYCWRLISRALCRLKSASPRVFLFSSYRLPWMSFPHVFISVVPTARMLSNAVWLPQPAS